MNLFKIQNSKRNRIISKVITIWFRLFVHAEASRLWWYDETGYIKSFRCLGFKLKFYLFFQTAKIGADAIKAVNGKNKLKLKPIESF